MQRRLAGAVPLATLLTGLALFAGAPSPLAGQDGAAGPPLFEAPLADPDQPRVGVALLTTDLFRQDGVPLERPSFGFDDPEAVGRELQAQVSVGSAIPLLAGRPLPGLRASVGIEGGVFGRFRLESRTYDLVGTDWTVALPVAVAWGPLAARVRLVHWSSHLGDEVVEESGARRIAYGYDAADLLLSYRTGHDARLYAGGSADLRSSTRVRGSRPGRVGRGGAVQAGAEITRRPFEDSRLAVLAAVDWKRSHTRAWRDQLSLVGGVERHRGDTRVRFLVRAYQGPSQLGQFFLTDERILAFELSLLR